MLDWKRSALDGNVGFAAVVCFGCKCAATNDSLASTVYIAAAIVVSINPCNRLECKIEGIWRKRRGGQLFVKEFVKGFWCEARRGF